MKKMDNHEFADYISSIVNAKTSVDFAKHDPLTGKTVSRFWLIGVLLGAQLGIVANCYDGGAPFFFLANREGNETELFRKELDDYLRSNGCITEVYVETPKTTRKTDYMIFHVYGGLKSLANVLLTRHENNICYIYRDKSSEICYGFRMILLADTYMVIGCDQYGKKTFCYAFQKDTEKQEQVCENFRAYLLACGVTDNATSSGNNASNTAAEPACDREQEV